MKKLFALTGLLTLFVAAIGCKNINATKQTIQLDSIVEILEADKQVVQLLSETPLQSQINVYKEFYDFYSNEYDDLSNSEFYTHELDQMQLCFKYTKKASLEIDNWNKELNKSIVQLNGLKHDFEKSLITEDEFMHYLDTEVQVSSTLHKDVQKYAGTVSTCIRNYGELTFKLDSVRTEFKNRSN